MRATASMYNNVSSQWNTKTTKGITISFHNSKKRGWAFTSRQDRIRDLIHHLKCPCNRRYTWNSGLFDCISQSILAAIKCTVDWVAYKETDIYCSPFWRLEVQDQDTSRLQGLVRTRLLARRAVFSLCPHVVQGVRVLHDLFTFPRSHLLISSSWGLGPNMGIWEIFKHSVCGIVHQA